MSLIIMAVFDTEENGRSEYTEKTLESLYRTVDWSKHRLIVVDNRSCERTKELLKCRQLFEVITNPTNIGTARAINQGLKLRKEGEYCIKLDNDVVINQSGWLEEMEEAIESDPTIGILGLKRKDVDWDGEYVALPHKLGERWITVEKGTYIMGTCTMYNHRLVDKIGGLSQPGKYGFDDSLYSLRSELAGFWNAYMPHIDIDHIDTGENGYTGEKHRQASEVWDAYHKAHADYVSGARPLWEEFE